LVLAHQAVAASAAALEEHQAVAASVVALVQHQLQLPKVN
jgi:hypothetical protein